MKNRFHIDVRCDKASINDIEWGLVLFWLNFLLKSRGFSAHLVEYKKKGKK